MINKFHSQKNFIFIFFFIFVITFLIRFPYLFRSVYNWDEASYLIGAYLIKTNHIPWIDFWGNKSPFCYYVYYLLLEIFGQSIFSIRLAAVFVISISTYILYLIISKFTEDFYIVILSILLCILLQSTVLINGKSLTTEHLALIPILFSFYLSIYSEKNFNYFIIGVLIGIAVFIRSNLAFLSIIILLIPFFDKNNYVEKVKNLLLIIGGGLFILSLNILFFLSTNIDVFIKSFFFYPLEMSYLKNDKNFLIHLISIIRVSLAPVDLNIFIRFLFWFLGFAGFFYCILNFNKNKSFYIISIIYFTGISLSIVFSKNPFPHYLIQLIPFIVIFVFIFIINSRIKSSLLFTLTIAIVVSSISIFLDYSNLYKKYKSYETVYYDDTYKIKNYITKLNLNQNYTILATTDNTQLLYFLLEKRPLSKMIHTSDMAREVPLKYAYGEVKNKQSEIYYVLNQEPDLILIDIDLNNFLKRYKFKNDILAYFSNKYELNYYFETNEDRFSNVYLYKKIN